MTNDSPGSPLFPQYDLVCGNAWMLDLSQAILNLGFLAGAFILGYAADRYSVSSYLVCWDVKPLSVSPAIGTRQHFAGLILLG